MPNLCVKNDKVHIRNKNPYKIPSLDIHSMLDTEIMLFILPNFTCDKVLSYFIQSDI